MRRVPLLLPLLVMAGIGILWLSSGHRRLPSDPSSPSPAPRREERPSPPAREVPLPERKSPPVHGEATPKAPASTTAGTVRIFAHDAGRAVAEVRLLLVPVAGHVHENHTDEEPFIASTGEDGRAEIENVPAGSWMLHAKHRRYAILSVAAEVGGGRATDVALALQEGSVMHGIVSAPGGVPLAGTEITLLDPETLMPLPGLKSLSEEDGGYRIEGIPPGTLAFHAVHDRYRPHLRKPVLIPDPAQTLRLDVELEVGRRISGRVITQGNVPVPGAVVGATNETARSVVTDAGGRFLIEGLGDAPVNLFARALNYGVEYLRGVAPDTTDLEIRLFESGKLGGRVRADRLPEAFLVLLHRFEKDLGKELLVDSKTFRSPDGAFRFPEVKAGLYRVSAAADGFKPSEKVTVNVGIGEEVGGVELRLDPE